jgi:hypothetical protein
VKVLKESQIQVVTYKLLQHTLTPTRAQNTYAIAVCFQGSGSIHELAVVALNNRQLEVPAILVVLSEHLDECEYIEECRFEGHLPKESD